MSMEAVLDTLDLAASIIKSNRQAASYVGFHRTLLGGDVWGIILLRLAQVWL